MTENNEALSSGFLFPRLHKKCTTTFESMTGYMINGASNIIILGNISINELGSSTILGIDTKPPRHELLELLTTQEVYIIFKAITF